MLGAPPVMMGGYQMLVRGEPFRAKFRTSWEKPEALVPGKVTAVDFSMPDVNHTFLQGAPDYGAGAELVVPADGSESADVYGYSLRLSRRTLRRRRRRCFMRRGRLAGLS